MKVKYIHHIDEWLPGDFDPPPRLQAGSKHFSVWRVHPHPTEARVAMKVHGGGVGVWTMDGRLTHFFDRAADLSWVHGRADQALCLESNAAPSRSPGGLEALLRLREGTGLDVVRESLVSFPTGGMNYLVPAPGRQHFAAVWLDQASWGYELVDAAGHAQLAAARQWPQPTVSPPGFSQDGAFLVGCHFVKSGWWTDEIDDYWEYPADGGPRQCGTISVHELSTGAVTLHEVIVDLPAGWLPDRPDNAKWDMIWGPEFLDARTFSVWLPDHSTATLTLPLPAQVTIPHPLATQRPWPA